MLGACQGRAILGGPTAPLAVGAYHSLGFGDACAGNRIDDFCTNQDVTEVLDYHSDDPTVADIIPAKEHPRAAMVTHQYYVVGKSAGLTTLVFKGMFTDGSIREDALDIRVEAPDTFKIAPTTCYDASAAPDLLATPGATEGFNLQMLAGNDVLTGWLPDAVTAEGLTEQFADEDANDYTWQAPATPGVVQLQSSIVTKVDGALKAFGPDQVTEIDLGAPQPAAFTQPDYLSLQVQMHVGGKSPCHSPPIEIHSSTPSVCSGPSGETVWSGGGTDAYTFVHAEGNCVLAGAMPGGPALNTQTFPVFFVQLPPADLLQPPDLGVPCPVEGGSACVDGYYDVATCHGGVWVFKSSCGGGQVCDFVPDSSAGCVAGTSCAQCRGLR
jgi:hypothetical protein